MILNKSQAEAVYSAMCALNNVSGTINEVAVGSAKIHASSAGIEVLQDRTGPMEFYLTQAAFSAAYGLDGKQPRTAVYTAGIGWQVQDSQGRRGNYETEAEALAA